MRYYTALKRKSQALFLKKIDKKILPIKSNKKRILKIYVKKPQKAIVKCTNKM
jgi:hypothetical protein